MLYLIFAVILAAIVGSFVYLKFFQTSLQLKKAEELMTAEQFNEAGEIVRQILDNEKDNIPARYLRAKLLNRQGQFVLAISELVAIFGYPDFEHHIPGYEAYCLLADLYAKTKNWKKEIEAYRMVLNYNPDDINANHRTGKALFIHKDYQGAREFLEKALNLNTGLSDIYHDYGVCCYHASDFAKAEEFLIKSLTVSGNHSEAKFFLGNIYLKKGDIENAVPMLEQARKNRDHSLRSCFLLGEIYYKQENFAKAIEEMDYGIKYLKDGEEESHAYRYLLADCYEELNHINEAIHHWEKIVSRNPDYRNVRLKLDTYRQIVENESLSFLFSHTIEDIQPIIGDIIGSLNFSIINRHFQNQNEYYYKAYNTKRINDAPILIYFARVTREISEGEIIGFSKLMGTEKCSAGMYITTSKFSIRAKQTAGSKGIELYAMDYVKKIAEKFLSKQKKAQGK